MNKIELPEEIKYRLTNVASALSSILYKNEDSNKERIIIQNSKNMLHLIKSEIDNLINEFPDWEVTLYDYLKNELEYIENQIYNDDFRFEEERLKNLHLLSNTLERIFGKSIGTQKKHNELTLKQKILVLEYLGVLNALKSCKQEQQKANIISAIIGQDFSNVKKALTNNNRKPVEKGSQETKTKENLEVVHDFFKANGLSEIANEVQKSINTITKR